MINLTEKIIDKIKRNRISSTEIADCMNKTGAIQNVSALNDGHFKVGKVFWTYAYNESNWEHHEQIVNSPENAVVITEAFNCKNRAIFGELVAKYLLLYRQASALVVLSNLRDIPHLIKENWPIWLVGRSPIGCFNIKNKEKFDESIINKKRKFYDGSIAVCDDSGVVIIPKQNHTKEFLEKLNWIENQEDIWFDCLDRRKWSTFETVCLKKYLND